MKGSAKRKCRCCLSQAKAQSQRRWLQRPENNITFEVQKTASVSKTGANAISGFWRKKEVFASGVAIEGILTMGRTSR